MVQEKKRASYDTVRLAEYRLLNALAKNPAYIEDPRVSVELFVDEPAKSAYNAIIALVEQKINITPASLWQAASNIDYHVDQRTVQCIWNIDSEGASSLDDILGILKTAQLKNNLLDKVDDLKEQLEQPGDLDGGTLLSNIYGLDEMLQKSSRGDSPLISFSEWADMYIEDLKLRKAGRKYSYGDPFLDEYLYTGAYPGAITMNQYG